MTAIAQVEPKDWTASAVRWSGAALVAVVWLSSAIFGVYIVAYYGGAVPANTLQDWNATLPRLWEAETPRAAIGIGVHFFAGAILLLLGPLQLMSQVRNRWPALHRWTGRVYAFCAFMAGVGGLSFIALKGTVGGPLMSVAFGIYGAAMVIASVETVRNAMLRRMEVHRAWATRLYALAIGSWLYRMGYGFWFLFAGKAGHTEQFSGAFDYAMDFAFYVPPLIVAELFIRTRSGGGGAAVRVGSAAALAGAAAFVGLATYFFTVYEWGPAMLARFGA